MGESTLRLDKAVSELQRWIVQWSHRFKEAFNGHGLKQTVVPVGFENHKLGRNASPTIDTRPSRMASASARCEPLRRVFGALFHATAAAHDALAVVAAERFTALDFVFPVADVGRHGSNANTILCVDIAGDADPSVIASDELTRRWPRIGFCAVSQIHAHHHFGGLDAGLQRIHDRHAELLFKFLR